MRTFCTPGKVMTRGGFATVPGEVGAFFGGTVVKQQTARAVVRGPPGPASGSKKSGLRPTSCTGQKPPNGSGWLDIPRGDHFELNINLAFNEPTNEFRIPHKWQNEIDAQERGEAFALRLPGTSIETNVGPAHRERCLNALALFEVRDAARA